jgi:integrase
LTASGNGERHIYRVSQSIGNSSLKLGDVVVDHTPKMRLRVWFPRKTPQLRQTQAGLHLALGVKHGSDVHYHDQQCAARLAQARAHRSLRPLLERVGLPRIRFHDLRHTFATVMLSEEQHPRVIQEMLGHANISETMDTYSHALPDMQDSAVAAIESALL